MQLERWVGKFGDDYTKRNRVSPELIQRRAEVFQKIMQPLNPASILEVGCNIGANLIALISSFMALPRFVVGVEPNPKARRIAEISGLKIFPDSGQELQFLDDFFDMSFTCGVLIHCDLPEAKKVVDEMHRVTRRHLLFMEYFSDVDQEIEYRGEKGLLWKRNWPRLFKAWGMGHPVSSGFAGKEQGFDDVTWWLYQKGNQP